jgi:hypothetical protein
MTGIVILVSNHYCCTKILSTNESVLTSITIPVVLMFCPLMKQYSLVLPLYDRNSNTSEYCFITGHSISTTGMIILVSTASLINRASVQQEW